MPELQGRVMYHYRQDILRQVYRILGSADFIGNPVGLFTNVSSGVKDIFYEPFNGVVVHGNKELGIGIAKVGLAQFRYNDSDVETGSRKLCEEDCFRIVR